MRPEAGWAATRKHVSTIIIGDPDIGHVKCSYRIRNSATYQRGRLSRHTGLPNASRHTNQDNCHEPQQKLKNDMGQSGRVPRRVRIARCRRSIACRSDEGSRIPLKIRATMRKRSACVPRRTAEGWVLAREFRIRSRLPEVRLRVRRARGDAADRHV